LSPLTLLLSLISVRETYMSPHASCFLSFPLPVKQRTCGFRG